MHAADLSSWFKVEASVVSVEAFEATVSLRLLFWDVGHGTPKWKALRWGDLGEMHGRRVHAVNNRCTLSWYGSAGCYKDA